MTIKVSICIPTYNRSQKVLNQVEFILNEMALLNDVVELIIRDNASDDNTYDVLNDKFANHEKVKIYRNEINLGLINNLKRLAEDAKGDYVWFVGDDDKLYSGILNLVINKVDENKGLIFINHRAVYDDQSVALECAFVPKKHTNIYDIFRYSGTTMMFITACLYKRKLLNEIVHHQVDRLTLPLYVSFCCYEKEGVTFIDDIYIDNCWGDTSWAESSLKVFGAEVPKELLRILLISNEKLNVCLALAKYLRVRYKTIIKLVLSFIR